MCFIHLSANFLLISLNRETQFAFFHKGSDLTVTSLLPAQCHYRTENLSAHTGLTSHAPVISQHDSANSTCSISKFNMFHDAHVSDWCSLLTNTPILGMQTLLQSCSLERCLTCSRALVSICSKKDLSFTGKVYQRF